MFSYNSYKIPPMFLVDLQGDYIRVDHIERLLVSEVVKDLDSPTLFFVIAEVKYHPNCDSSVDLKGFETEKEDRDWMDSLVRKLNGVAD